MHACHDALPSHILMVQEHEVFPAPNPAVLAEIEGADAIVYAMGSLYTSICPSLVLQVVPSQHIQGCLSAALEAA